MCDIQNPLKSTCYILLSEKQLKWPWFFLYFTRWCTVKGKRMEGGRVDVKLWVEMCVRVCVYLHIYIYIYLIEIICRCIHTHLKVHEDYTFWRT